MCKHGHPFIAAVLASVIATGCVTTTYSASQATTFSGAAQTYWKHHAIWGLLFKGEVAPLCPSDHPTLEGVKSREMIWGYLLLGLFTSTQVEVYCQ